MPAAHCSAPPGGVPPPPGARTVLPRLIFSASSPSMSTSYVYSPTGLVLPLTVTQSIWRTSALRVVGDGRRLMD